MRDNDHAMAAQVERALLLLEGSKVHRGGREIRFRCLVHHDRHPSADYSREEGIWTCRSCGASGGLSWGDAPLAPLVGIAIDSPMSIDMAEWDKQQARLRAVRAEAETRARDALSTYWRERRLVDELVRHGDVLERLVREGIGQLAADHFRFGYTEYFTQGPALTIPWTVRGDIRGLQYRLLQKRTGDRYRWHEGSRTDTFFNADAIVAPDSDTIVIVEGAKKAACLWSHGVTSVCAVVNKTFTWRPQYSPWFKPFARVVFLPDPDAIAEAETWAGMVPGARVARLPMKPDDLLVETGGDVDMLWGYVQNARKAA